MSLDARLQQIWYRRSHPLSLLLAPLSWLFGAVVRVRRAAFRRGWLGSQQVGCPVIVVGNITVGGTGKTPLVMWLTNELQARGLKPGIVIRGYGGRSQHWPREVQADSDPQDVGDEAVLLCRGTGAIVVAGPDRPAAARLAIQRGADVVVCDDGLQHYRLRRDCELAVIDARRGVGNGRLLPAGPLREPASRLQEVDLVLLNLRDGEDGTAAGAGETMRQAALGFAVRPGVARALTGHEVRPLASFVGERVHAVAGIGHPEAFFDSLRNMGIELDARALPDHARLTRTDIEFDDALPVLMTGKDAVKCHPFADARHWAVSAELTMTRSDAQRLLAVVQRAIDRFRSTS